jgi:cytoskeletal protein RodZ
MKKGRFVGIILAFILIIGIGFGVQQVLSNRADHKPVTSASSKPAAASSNSASNNAADNQKSSKTKDTANQKKPTAHKAKSGAASTQDQSNKSGATSSQGAHAKASQTSSTRAAATTNSEKSKDSKSTHPRTTTATHTRQSKKAAAQDNSVGTAYIKVSGYKKTFYTGHLKISKKTTAFSLLKQTHLKLVYQSSPHVYVSSINGLKQNDIKVGSGWMYSVNGKYVDKAADQKRITAGDKVHWYFTVNGLNGK